MKAIASMAGVWMAAALTLCPTVMEAQYVWHHNASPSATVTG